MNQKNQQNQYSNMRQSARPKTRMFLTAITALTLASVSLPQMIAEANVTPNENVQAQAAMQGASTYLTKTQMTSMENWSIVANFAANHIDTQATWTPATLHGIKATTDIETQILALLAAHLDPSNYQSLNFVKMVDSRQTTTGEFADDNKGTVSGSVTGQAFAILALQDAGDTHYQLKSAVKWLLSQQNPDGGFPYQTGTTSDTNTTAYVVNALLLAGVSPSNSAVVSAVKYLEGLQQKDGGFAYDKTSTNSDSDSTGTVVDALIAAGVAVPSLEQGSYSPLTALLSYVDKKTGGALFDTTGGEYSGVNGFSSRDEVFGLSAYLTGKSIYQRLQTKKLTDIDSYWTGIESAGGINVNGQKVAWNDLKDEAVAGSYKSSFDKYWQEVMTHHGYWTTVDGKPTFVRWSNALARQSLVATFGLNAVDLAQL